MKLTAEQIAVIEETLILNGLKFEDLKLELTDHIASEIEEVMNTNTLSFEENLISVFSKWSDQLRPSCSFWINTNKKYWWFSTEINPSLATYKCNKVVKKILKLSLFISLLASILLTVITRNWHSEVALNFLKSGFKMICFAVFILFVLARYMIWKSKRITTFGYLFTKNAFTQIIYLFFLGIGIFPIRIYTADFGLDLLFNFFPLMVLSISIFYLQLAYNHVQFNKKLVNLY